MSAVGRKHRDNPLARLNAKFTPFGRWTLYPIFIGTVATLIYLWAWVLGVNYPERFQVGFWVTIGVPFALACFGLLFGWMDSEDVLED